MSQYTASVPHDGSVNREILTFFEEFYRISDTPEAHEQYCDQFTSSAQLTMASNTANGREEILKLRKGMWEKVAKRSHKPGQIYPFGPGSDDVMLYGTVEYVLKTGSSKVVDWAARAKFSRQENKLKMHSYQVYLDTAAMTRGD